MVEQCGGYAAEAEPQEFTGTYGKPEAFRKESGRAAKRLPNRLTDLGRSAQEITSWFEFLEWVAP